MSTLRLQFKAPKSTVPARINQVSISDFEHTGFLMLRFSFQQESFEFKVPYIRPYKKKPLLSNTVNINGGTLKNQAFEDFQMKTTHNYTQEVKIECNYTIL
ncbi:hypothetical protein [Mongoliitalea lutea]|uniref:Uncharacterized protein n=1 Tax=Mongoliitalea lutea TaxID=849756 RepID=A0A8J3G6L7_9BACT|nr:hypothetical protein [Mongoliitalea lutea]GHB49212.1 hypothetical protein GCM10008106_32520 [Mongoliitalea lutea]